MEKISKTFLQHWRMLLPYAGLALAVAVVYADVYSNDFLLDDQSLIITDRFLRNWKFLPDIFTHLSYAGSGAEKGFYRPVATTLQLFLYQMFGQSKAAFHALNVILHGANTLLMYRLGRKLNFNATAVFAAALIWGVHPLVTSDVTYISSLPELLWTMFCLSGLLVLLPDFAPRNVCIALLLFLLAIGSKETAVVFPALATSCLFIVSKDRLKAAAYIKTWPLWLISALYIAVYMHMMSYHSFEANTPDQDAYAHHIVPRILTFLAALPVYLALIFYPAHLHMERYFPIFLSVFSWQVAAGTALAAAVLVQFIIGRGKRGIALSFGLFWFAAAISPVTGIVVPTDALISEGWLYMPGIGLALGTAQTLSIWIDSLKFKQRQIVATAAVAATALCFGIKTHFQNKIYQTPVTFYDNIFKCGGYRERAYPDLGVYYLNRHDFENAAKYFNLALQYPDERNVSSSVMHEQLALAYLGVTGDENYMITPEAVMEALPGSAHIPEAVNELKQAVAADPHFHFAYGLLWMIYKWQGKPEEAAFYYDQMMQNPQ